MSWWCFKLKVERVVCSFVLLLKWTALDYQISG
jgi:hypothetical protein